MSKRCILDLLVQLVRRFQVSKSRPLVVRTRELDIEVLVLELGKHYQLEILGNQDRLNQDLGAVWDYEALGEDVALAEQ